MPVNTTSTFRSAQVRIYPGEYLAKWGSMDVFSAVRLRCEGVIPNDHPVKTELEKLSFVRRETRTVYVHEQRCMLFTWGAQVLVKKTQMRFFGKATKCLVLFMVEVETCSLWYEEPFVDVAERTALEGLPIDGFLSKVNVPSLVLCEHTFYGTTTFSATMSFNLLRVVWKSCAVQIPR
ncbi:hypothetical protein GIB67_015772 [Kingdonia uniflora]|uniref:Uncharacterized protein n=1 Tax=Kingdonia uniflora TaxID=39325 RepID=A0A7J7NUT8_9MAGN|nr:hypothetical protein GIB67_015772 [Kingdonia uniflora]